MAESKAETVTLRLNQQIDSAADAAMGALGRLEARIVREQSSLGRLEESLGRAQAKLAALGEGAADPKAVAAFDKQKAAVGELEAKLGDVQAKIAQLGKSGGDADMLAGARSSAEALQSKLVEATAKLRDLGAATGASVNTEAYRKQAAVVASMGDRVAAQRDKIVGLGESFKKAKGEAEGSDPPFRAIGKSMRMLGGASGEVESKLTEMFHLFRKLGPQIAIVVAGILILGGVIGVVVGGFVKAISASSELRDEYMKLEVAGVTLWNSQRASAASAAQLQASVDKVAGSSALARDKVADYAVQLRNARFTGKQLETALTAMSTAGAAGGDQLASQFFETAKAARYFGGDVDKLAKRIEDKFGGVAAAKMRSLDVQMMKLHENIAFIFSGADIEPFLKGLQSILSIFDRNGKEAQSMRAIVTSLTEKAIGGFLRLAITLVRTYIWLKTHKTAWDLLGLSVKGIGIVFIALGTVAAAMFAVFVAGAVAGAAAIAAVGVAVAKVYDFFAGLYDYWHSHSLADIGTAMIDGLVDGLKAAGGKVLEALKSIVMGAVGGVKSLLGIHSPSALMREEVGFQMGAGIAEGHEKSSPVVASSASNMVTGAVQSAKSSVGDAPAGAAMPSISFTQCYFGGDLTESKMRGWIMNILEGELQNAGVPT